MSVKRVLNFLAFETFFKPSVSTTKLAKSNSREEDLLVFLRLVPPTYLTLHHQQATIDTMNTTDPNPASCGICFEPYSDGSDAEITIADRHESALCRHAMCLQVSCVLLNVVAGCWYLAAVDSLLAVFTLQTDTSLFLYMHLQCAIQHAFASNCTFCPFCRATGAFSAHYFTALLADESPATTAVSAEVVDLLLAAKTSREAAQAAERASQVRREQFLQYIASNLQLFIGDDVPANVPIRITTSDATGDPGPSVVIIPVRTEAIDPPGHQS